MSSGTRRTPVRLDHFMRSGGARPAGTHEAFSSHGPQCGLQSAANPVRRDSHRLPANRDFVSGSPLSGQRRQNAAVLSRCAIDVNAFADAVATQPRLVKDQEVNLWRGSLKDDGRRWTVVHGPAAGIQEADVDGLRLVQWVREAFRHCLEVDRLLGLDGHIALNGVIEEPIGASKVDRLVTKFAGDRRLGSLWIESALDGPIVFPVTA